VALIMAVAAVVGNAVAGSGQMWHGFGLNALWLLAFGVSVAGFVPSWGANGLALAFAISYVFLALLVTLYAFVRLRVRFASSGVLAGLTAGCVLFTVSLPKGLSAVWLVAAAVAAECALLAVEWYLVLDEGERRRLIEAAGQIHRFNALPRRSGVSYVTSRVPRSGPEELAKSQE
jgi:O-antigen/teichoic acid export membrane protein